MWKDVQHIRKEAAVGSGQETFVIISFKARLLCIVTIAPYAER